MNLEIENVLAELFDAHQTMFFEYTRPYHHALLEFGCCFGYYTSVDTAISIMRGRQVWMRTTQVMNDPNEVQYGFEGMMTALEGDAGQSLAATVNNHHVGLMPEVLHRYLAWMSGHNDETFITSLTVHQPSRTALGTDTAQELSSPTLVDRYGRLALWRGYGGSQGAALIIRGQVFFRHTPGLRIKSMPVLYADQRGPYCSQVLHSIRRGIHANQGYFQSLGRDGASDALVEALKLVTITLKHPAFAEEMEWRIIATTESGGINFGQLDVVNIGGLPQQIIRVPLRDDPSFNLIGLEPDALIERVIVGPSAYPGVTRRPLLEAMQEAGIQNPGSRLMDERIPVRANQR